LTEERVKKIKDHLRKRGVAVGQPFEKRGYVYPVLDEVKFCVFYDKKTKRCKVHEVKPETCVAGPVTFDINCQTKKLEWFLKTAEICAFAGELHRNRERLTEHFKTARQQILELINRLDADSLRAILKIEEPQTFKIGEETLATDVAKKLGIN
jgi:Fe-S-cluster containining protein